MAVQIRLARHGSKKSPYYRIVVSDARSPRDGRYIEAVGTFNPCVEPPKLELDADRLEYWRGQGAKPSPTLSQIIKKHATQNSAAQS
jgi:small subunit ribosomal protein S16